MPLIMNPRKKKFQKEETPKGYIKNSKLTKTYLSYLNTITDFYVIYRKRENKKIFPLQKIKECYEMATKNRFDSEKLLHIDYINNEIFSISIEKESTISFYQKIYLREK